MQLVHDFTFRATLKPPLEIGAVPTGARVHYSRLDTTFFVGEGRMRPNLGVEYRVWRPQ